MVATSIPPVRNVISCAGGGARSWYGWAEDILHPYQASSRRLVLPLGVS